MNTDIFKAKLIGETTSIFSWSEDSNERDYVKLSTKYKCNKYDDEIAISVIFDTDGNLLTSFIFDAIQKNEDTLKLVNYFNENVSELKASIGKINRTYYLFVEYNISLIKKEDDAVEHFLHALDVLYDNKTFNYLNPLTVITEG